MENIFADCINYFHSTNQLYLCNEWIDVFLFNQIVIKYMVNKT